MPEWHPYCSGPVDAHVVLGILVASLRAVGCAATLAAAGFLMARLGYMTPAVSKGLSQMSMKILIPSLLFSSVVPGITPALFEYAWPLLLLPAVYLLIGVVIGVAVLLIVRPRSNFRLGTVAACTFGNTTGIPIILLSVMQQSLSRSVFAELADPLLFLSLQLVTFPLLQWLLGLLLFEREGCLASLLLSSSDAESFFLSRADSRIDSRADSRADSRVDSRVDSRADLLNDKPVRGAALRCACGLHRYANIALALGQPACQRGTPTCPSPILTSP